MDNYAKTPQWKEQRAKTCMERYGTKNFFNQDKIKQTMFQKYGGHPLANPCVIKKILDTKKQNLIKNKEYLIGYTEDGDWIEHKCMHGGHECYRTYRVSHLCYDAGIIKKEG